MTSPVPSSVSPRKPATPRPSSRQASQPSRCGPAPAPLPPPDALAGAARAGKGKGSCTVTHAASPPPAPATTPPQLDPSGREPWRRDVALAIALSHADVAGEAMSRPRPDFAVAFGKEAPRPPSPTPHITPALPPAAAAPTRAILPSLPPPPGALQAALAILVKEAPGPRQTHRPVSPPPSHPHPPAHPPAAPSADPVQGGPDFTPDLQEKIKRKIRQLRPGARGPPLSAQNRPISSPPSTARTRTRPQPPARPPLPPKSLPAHGPTPCTPPPSARVCPSRPRGPRRGGGGGGPPERPPGAPGCAVDGRCAVLCHCHGPSPLSPPYKGGGRRAPGPLPARKARPGAAHTCVFLSLLHPTPLPLPPDPPAQTGRTWPRSARRSAPRR